MINRILELKSLPDDWNGYGASAAKPEAINKALLVAELLQKQVARCNYICKTMLAKDRQVIQQLVEALRQADALITEITPELSDAPKYPDKWHEQYYITQALALAEPYLQKKEG